jgi:hypothetical protein
LLHLSNFSLTADSYSEVHLAKGRSQFIGAAGQYFVSYGLAVRQINASLTIGNAPSVDVLAASHDGSRTLAIQVKTSRYAHVPTYYVYKDCRDWNVGVGAIGKQSDNFWYAFVDLRESASGNWAPEVFFVPSVWVAHRMKPNFSMMRFTLRSEASLLTRERWDMVKGFLSGEESAIAWARHLPPEATWP